MITLHVDIKELETLVKWTWPDFVHRVPIAVARTLDDVVELVQVDLIQETEEKFDRVTPWVKRGILREYTKDGNLTVSVYGNIGASGGFSTGRLLPPHLRGGGRDQKRFERRLGNGYIVPGAGAKLNKHGNLVGAELVQLLSAVGRLGDQNRTEGSKQRNSGNQRNFFRRGNVIFERDRDGAIKPVLVVVQSVSYEQRLDWVGRTQAVLAKAFMPAFTLRMNEAVERAKKKAAGINPGGPARPRRAR